MGDNTDVSRFIPQMPQPAPLPPVPGAPGAPAGAVPPGAPADGAVPPDGGAMPPVMPAGVSAGVGVPDAAGFDSVVANMLSQQAPPM